jgi:hypothetical protein
MSEVRASILPNRAAVKTVTGQCLAKSSVGYPLWARAEDAARWLSGEVVVRPTAKMACQIFRVSYPTLKHAQTLIWQNRPRVRRVNGNGNGSGAPSLISDDALDRLVAAIGADRVLAAIDRATQPSLPFVAAEVVS